MRVLNLSLDMAILENGSAVQKRLLALSDRVPPNPLAEGEKAGEITVFVPAEKDEIRKLSEHLTVYAFGGSKLIQFWKMWRRGKRLLGGNSSFPKGGTRVGEGGGFINPSAHQNEPLPFTKGELRPYDLITVQDVYFLGFLAVRLGKKFSVPVEVQVHGLEKMRGGRARLARFVLEHAKKIRVVSERLKKEMDSRFKIPTCAGASAGRQDSRMYVLPVYTQVEIPQRLPKQKTVPYPFTFLTVGRLVPVKNIDLQIRAFAKLAEEVPHIRLRIVGGGPLEQSLRSEVASYKLEDKIFFEGEQRDVGKYYEGADAFLLTSDYEGWGRVVLEASAYRLPIIMTNVGLALEVIKNEESGLVIPVGDEQELIRAMKELLDKPELRQRLGESAYRTFKELPDMETQIQKQVTEWGTLMDRK